MFPVTTRLKGNAAGNVLKSLLNKGLIKEVRAKRDDTVWRHDEERGRMTLVATKPAFAALGIDPQDAGEDAEAAADEAPTNVEAEPNPHERGQCAAEAERHCDHGRLHDSLSDFAPPSQMSEVALRLDRLGRIDAKTKQRFLRRLFSGYARDVLDFISVHKTDSPIASAPP